MTRGFAEQNYDPVSQPEIGQLAQQVTVEIDEALTAAFPARQGAEIVVALTNGSELHHLEPDVAPASNDLVRERFVAAASDAVGEPSAAAIASFIDALEARDGSSELMRLCRTEARDP
jgi:2-methylcitrate dehydratase PrpD